MYSCMSAKCFPTIPLVQILSGNSYLSDNNYNLHSTTVISKPTFSFLTRRCFSPSNRRSTLLKAERELPEESESEMDFSTILGKLFAAAAKAGDEEEELEEEEKGEEKKPPKVVLSFSFESSVFSF